MKSIIKISAVALVLVLFSSSCAKTFYSVDSKALSQKHRSVAIMPSIVAISSKGANRKVAAEVLERQEAVEAQSFQQAVNAWIQKRKSEGKVTVQIQDIEITNARLKDAGYPETLLTNAKICEILGVDAIIVSNFELSKPMTFEEAIALTIALGIVFASDEVIGTIGISDCAENKLIWSYRHKISGYSPISVVEAFMKKASRKMPYVN